MWRTVVLNSGVVFKAKRTLWDIMCEPLKMYRFSQVEGGHITLPDGGQVDTSEGIVFVPQGSVAFITREG